MCARISRSILLLTGLLLTTAAGAADGPLTEEQVCDFIATRVASNHLQEYFKRNADDYSDAPRAFFKARDAMLRAQGWTVDGYEATRQRIHAAISGIRSAQEVEEEQAELDERIAGIRANSYFSDEQKEQMIAVERRLVQARLDQAAPTRRDWPAVKPQLQRLERLIDWVAMNIEEPPRDCEGKVIAAPTP